MSEYSIRVEIPIRARRGSTRLIVVVLDVQGTEVFRDRADINEDRTRMKVAERIAQITGDSPDEVNRRFLRALAQMQPPGNGGGPGGPAGGQVTPFPYEATPGGIIWNKETLEGIIPVPLTTFTALITGQVLENDGAETRRLLEIEASLRGRTTRFQVASGQFAVMTWPMENMGAAAALWAGFGIKDHARAAIQFLSGDPPEHQVYAHLGWGEIGGQWVYLHAGGAIGPIGLVPDIDVVLPPDLQQYQIPTPPTGTALAAAVRASLRVLEVAGDRMTFPPYCGLWRAVLGGADHSVHLVGPTGAGKTEIAALVQQHHGAEMDSRHLPGSWLSTDNALENLAFLAKDSLLVVDDFSPTAGQHEVQALHRKADRLFRAQGNVAGRGRLRSDGTARPTRPPRGMILSTG